jgi:hypothetical protein
VPEQSLPRRPSKDDIARSILALLRTVDSLSVYELKGRFTASEDVLLAVLDGMAKQEVIKRTHEEGPGSQRRYWRYTLCN